MSIIDKPSDYFNTKLWTGNATDNTAITGVGFSPDWVWIKNRSTTDSHHLADTIIGAGKRLRSDTTAAVGDQADGVKSFDSDGITIGTTGSLNGSGNSIVGWFWRGSDSSAVSNTDGSITSSVSANQDAGFSIVSWTGTGANATVGHGLGAEPKMIFLKIRTGTNNWQVYNKSIGSGNALFLNTTDASSSNTGWQSTDATSSVFYVSGGTAVNGSGASLIAYCFADTSMSKMGSYTGNGSTDGTFVYTGQKSAFVMIKRTDSAGSWYMYDNKINPENVMDTILLANTSAAESTNSNENLDFLSNGFKLRTTSAARNASGGSYIYMAFAENPFVTSSGVCATAR